MTLQHCFEVIQVLISVNTEPLELDVVIPYLGFKVAYNNRDWVDLYQNIRKARQQWWMVGKVVKKAGATARTHGELNLVLLYRSKSRVVTGSMLKVL